MSAWKSGAWYSGAWYGTAWYSAVAYSISAEQGSHTLSGQPANLLVHRTLTADQGGITLSGQDASLVYGYGISAEQGSYTLSGQAATLVAPTAGRAWATGAWRSDAWHGTAWANVGAAGAFSIAADQGSYTLSGQQAALTKGNLLSAETGYYTYTGDDALRDILMRAEAGSHALTGQDATIGRGLFITADAGYFSASGISANLNFGYYMEAQSGGYVLDGQSVNFSGGLGITADAGSYTISGQDAALFVTRTLTAESGSYALTGYDAIFNAGQILIAANGPYTLTGYDATFSKTYVLGAQTGYYTLGGQIGAIESPEVEQPRTGGGWIRKVPRGKRRFGEYRMPSDDEIREQREKLGILKPRARRAIERAAEDIINVGDEKKIIEAIANDDKLEKVVNDSFRREGAYKRKAYEDALPDLVRSIVIDELRNVGGTVDDRNAMQKREAMLSDLLAEALQIYKNNSESENEFVTKVLLPLWLDM